MTPKTKVLASVSFALLLSLPLAAYSDVVDLPPEAGKGADKPPAQYTVKKGDTLWHISGRFLNNPFKWPSVWKQNPYIKNPHLIYPGDRVRITPDGIEIIGRTDAPAPPEAAEPLPVVGLEPEPERVVVLESLRESIGDGDGRMERPRLASSALARSGFISRDELDISGAIAGPKEKKLNLSEGDDVFVKFKDAEDVKAGDRYAVFVVGRKIVHPATKKELGNIIDLLGSVEITGTGDVVEARIDNSFKEIAAGSKLRAYKEPPVEVEVTAAESRVDGYIVASLDGKEELSRGDIVYIDKGVGDGLKKGNLMSVYRPRKEMKDPLEAKKTVEVPPAELGTVIVAEAGEKTSVCIVVKGMRPMNIGDRVKTQVME